MRAPPYFERLRSRWHGPHHSCSLSALVMPQAGRSPAGQRCGAAGQIMCQLSNAILDSRRPILTTTAAPASSSIVP